MQPFRASRPFDVSVVPTQRPPEDDELEGVVAPLASPEVTWLAQHRELVADLCDHETTVEAIGSLFDRVHDAWRQSSDLSDPLPLTHAFGVALGDLVVERLPTLEWSSYSDAAGTELVLGHPRSALVVFPISSVAAHWSTAAPGWFQAHVDVVTTGAARLLAGG